MQAEKREKVRVGEEEEDGIDGGEGRNESVHKEENLRERDESEREI